MLIQRNDRKTSMYALILIAFAHSCIQKNAFFALFCSYFVAVCFIFAGKNSDFDGETPVLYHHRGFFFGGSTVELFSVYFCLQKRKKMRIT